MPPLIESIARFNDNARVFKKGYKVTIISKQRKVIFKVSKIRSPIEAFLRVNFLGAAPVAKFAIR